MSFLTKLMDTMRLDNDDDDDYFLDDDYEEEEKPAKKSIFNKKPVVDDLDDDFEEEPKPRFLPTRANNSNSKVVSMRRSMEVSLIKPTSLEDAKEIYDYVEAFRALEYSTDRTMIYNPSGIDLWLRRGGKDYKIPARAQLSFRA